MVNQLSIPNPALEPLGILVGEWDTTGSHPLMPGAALHGHVVFEWIEGGAFLRMYSEVDHPKFPTGVAIFGSDADNGGISMLYFDDRKVSRICSASIDGRVWKWWRDDPSFSQRFVVEISEDGSTMNSKGEMRRNGKSWEGDLELSYTRVG
jgi:hypothetical protein